jgi:transposase
MRLLKAKGIESHVVDPASIATSRHRRRAKTDSIDGETLLRALLAYKRGEPRVCAMVKPPTVEEVESQACQAPSEGPRCALDGEIHQGQAERGWLNASLRSGDPALWISEPRLNRPRLRLHPQMGGKRRRELAA